VPDQSVPDTEPTDADRPSYEQAREELAEVVRRLETGGATLEESLALWERGEALATICQDWLDGARARLAAAAARDGASAEDTD
jgi:exodeoxyribonuclease VII small subunit